MTQYQFQNSQGAPWGRSQPLSAAATDTLSETMTGLLPKVYAWMFVALAISGAVAYWAANATGLTQALATNPLLWLLVMFGWLGLGLGISFGINRLSAGAATALFIIYSVLAGLALSFVFIVYTTQSIASAFFVAAGMFGLMSLIGFVVKRDLSRFGGFLMMALIGVLMLGLVGFFVPSLWTAYTWLGLIVFLGLAVYETNIIKRQVAQYEGTGAGYERKFAIFWALQLYLTFVNIFLFLLRIMGGQR